MKKLDPQVLFQRIVVDVPPEMLEHLFVTGSLACAYHFQTQLEGRAVNTKDVDLVVHPAGNVKSCQEIAQRLLDCGWVQTAECFARSNPMPGDQLRAIRLYPPRSHDYFIEFLNLPEQEQSMAKRLRPAELADGWYGLPTFRFMGLTALHRLRSEVGLEYAAPPMMALANLLSHPTVGAEQIQSGTMQGIRRATKDLGRVLTLARLAGREQSETWLDLWPAALKECFPSDWRSLATHAGDGLKELLADPAALDEACQTTEIGLLNGLGVTAENLRATGERLVLDLLEPLAADSRTTGPL